MLLILMQPRNLWFSHCSFVFLFTVRTPTPRLTSFAVASELWHLHKAAHVSFLSTSLGINPVPGVSQGPLGWMSLIF